MALSRPPEAPELFVWRKLSPARWEDVWQERLGWLGQRLVIFVLRGLKTLRLEAHHVTRAEADELVREFGGAVRVSKEITPEDLEPKPRAPLKVRGKLVIVGQLAEREAWEKAGVPCIFIPATMAFGTGDHATTATCLRLLADEAETLATATWEALDLGTGSGILALAARLLGARKVLAGDFDATAVRLAKENAAHNGVRGVSFKKFDVLKWRPERQWPVVLANVYGPILIEAAPQIAAAVEADGCLILSGILREQAVDVLPAFERLKLRAEKIVKKGKWVTARLRRVNRPAKAGLPRASTN